LSGSNCDAQRVPSVPCPRGRSGCRRPQRSPEGDRRRPQVPQTDRRGGRILVRRADQRPLLLARTARENFGATWGLSETGAAGPTGNPYGDAAGHSCLAVSGPVETAFTLETGEADRAANMDAFALAALQLLLGVLGD